MKMIPTSPRTTPSRAEEAVFALLERANIDGISVCFHSLNLSRHVYKRMSELDFVLLGTSGLFVLEVKGGGVSCTADGCWHHRDRYGQIYPNWEGPFRQASSGMFSLVDMLDRTLPADSIRTTVCCGYGVVFPDCRFSAASVEWPHEAVIDAESVRTVERFERAITAMIRYWRKASSGLPCGRELDSDKVKRISQCLRPRFDVVPLLSTQVDLIDGVMAALTEEQYSRLDAVCDNARILVEGGAGSGKTFLAVEVARRAGASGRRVLFSCLSRVTSAFLQGAMAGATGVSVVAMDDVAKMVWSNRFSAFDVLIIDEGQDVLSAPYMDVADKAIVGGLQSGVWRIFYDANNQSGLLGAYDPEIVQLLRAYGGVSVKLSRNCRNTRDIVTQIRCVTGADVGVAVAGSGPPVRYSYASSRSEASVRLGTELESIIDQGIEPGDITILSPVDF